jgi:hypothetical protein
MIQRCTSNLSSGDISRKPPAHDTPGRVQPAVARKANAVNISQTKGITSFNAHNS